MSKFTDEAWKDLQNSKYEYENTLKGLNETKEQYQEALTNEVTKEILEIINTSELKEHNLRLLLGDLVRRTRQMYVK